MSEENEIKKNKEESYLIFIILIGTMLSAAVSFYFTFKVSSRLNQVIERVEDLDQAMVFYEEDFASFKESVILRDDLSKISIPLVPDEDQRVKGSTGGLEGFYCENGKKPIIIRFKGGVYYHTWENDDSVTSRAMLTLEKAVAKGKFVAGKKYVYINELDTQTMFFQSYRLKIFQSGEDGTILRFGTNRKTQIGKEFCPRNLNLL